MQNMKVNLAIFCLFTFAFFTLMAWCFVAVVQARGHRSPYTFPIPALIFSLIGNAINISRLTSSDPINIFRFNSILFHSMLGAVQYLFTNWANPFPYLSIIAVVWNRETKICAATGGKAGQHNYVVTGVNTILVVLLFVTGATGPALLLKHGTGDRSPHFQNVINAMFYSSCSLLILTEVTVIISAVSLQRASHVEGVADKVCIPCTWLC